MHFTSIILFVAAAALPATQAFKCPVAQYGECYYKTGRCAMKCTSGPVNVECHCPAENPEVKGDKYTGKHECIGLGKYNGRHKCK
jgi:hypothetical protein